MLHFTWFVTLFSKRITNIFYLQSTDGDTSFAHFSICLFRICDTSLILLNVTYS